MPSFIASVMAIFSATIVDKVTIDSKVERQLTDAWDDVKYTHYRPTLVRISCIIRVNKPRTLLLTICILLKYQSTIYSTFDVP